MNRKNHITCGAALEWIHLLLDEQLQPLEHQKLLAHLQSCANCSAAYRELSLIENAHTELDQPLAAIPGGYFEELPERVLARMAQAEARSGRTFSLPKPQLPKVALPGWLQQFIFGRGKYALAFAAMAMLAFIVTRELRQDFSPEGIGLQQTPAETPPALQEPAAFSSSPMAEQSQQAAAPQLKSNRELETNLETEKLPPSSIALAPQNETFLSDAQADGGAPGRQDLATEPEEEAQIAQSLESEVDNERVELGDSVRIGLYRSSLAQLQNVRVEDSAKSVLSRSFAEDAAGENKPASLSPPANAGEGTAAAAQSYSAEERTSRALRAVSSAPASAALFEQTGAQARQAPTEERRREIWQEFLKNQPDSIHYRLAVAQIANSYAGEIDSASIQAQMEEAFQFYGAMESVLRLQWSGEAYARERARVEGLLRWKKTP